jgi:hypoxanthine phosphoribosyltransferase
MHDDIAEVLFDKKQIEDIVKRLGRQITEDYKDKNLLLIGVLKGSVVFMSDLMRSIDIKCKIDFMALSSYGNGTESGTIRLLKDLSTDIKGYDVLIVEDILDSGKTLSHLREMLLLRQPRSMKICTFFDKPDRRAVADMEADYVGAVIPDKFIVGYGLDFAENYRNLEYVGVLKPELYK